MEQPNIKTYEDACQTLGINPETLPDFSMLAEPEQKALMAHYKLTVITKALNGNWVPNWNDGSQWKHYPWFYMKGGFSFGDVNYSYSHSYVGSRLCFETEEMAEYAATQFLDLYKDYFVIA